VPVKATPLVCGPAKAKLNLAKLPTETLTDNSPAPLAVKLPSLTLIEADSTLYKLRLAVATPSVKTTLVAVPKSVPPTFGAVTGDDELFAPLNVKLLLPVYPVTVLPFASFAVIVIV
jgi:hypothetical protein